MLNKNFNCINSPYYVLIIIIIIKRGLIFFFLTRYTCEKFGVRKSENVRDIVEREKIHPFKVSTPLEFFAVGEWMYS